MKWKKLKKLTKKGKEFDKKEFELTSKETFDGDVLEKQQRYSKPSLSI